MEKSPIFTAASLDENTSTMLCLDCTGKETVYIRFLRNLIGRKDHQLVVGRGFKIFKILLSEKYSIAVAHEVLWMMQRLQLK